MNIDTCLDKVDEYYEICCFMQPFIQTDIITHSVSLPIQDIMKDKGKK